MNLELSVIFAIRSSCLLIIIIGVRCALPKRHSIRCLDWTARNALGSDWPTRLICVFSASYAWLLLMKACVPTSLTAGFSVFSLNCFDNWIDLLGTSRMIPTSDLSLTEKWLQFTVKLSSVYAFWSIQWITKYILPILKDLMEIYTFNFVLISLDLV